MSLITRNIINKNILFCDYDSKYKKTEYGYKHLSKRIDFFKNFLIDQGCKRGDSILIGYAVGLDQTSAFFAASELGLVIIVADYKVLDNEEYVGFLDTKTKILMPIKYFLFREHHDAPEDFVNFKLQFYNQVCETVIKSKQIEEYSNYEPNDTIWAKESDILMRCTSSGTTGTPKKVTHTHEFLHNISKRNSIFFDNEVTLLWNLNHGSSLATYFVPALMSDNVTNFNNAIKELQDTPEAILPLKDALKNSNHVMIPYPETIERFIEVFEFPELTYYTLSPISNKIRNGLSNGRCKDIISFFGSNETSGPVLINKASYDNFEVDVYHKVDDYYDIEEIDTLTVRLKEYGISINTQDTFEKKDETSLTFKGRKNLMRVNGLEVFRAYNDLIDFDADLIYDSVYNEIYLAAWMRFGKKEFEEYVLAEKIKEINEKMSNMSGGSHKISKFKFLKRYQFTLGVKIDHEFLRSYFRERVENNVEV